MIHNQLTNYAKLLVGFRRALGEMSVDFSGIERAGETLTPTIDLWSLPEWAILRGENMFGRVATAPAVAARRSSCELVNPANSGILVVVTEIFVTGDACDVSVDAGASIAANPVTTNGVPRDTRFPNVGAVSRATFTTGDVAAGVSLPTQFLGSTNRVTTPFVISPGNKLFLINITNNTAVLFGVQWVERALLPNEGNA